MCSTWQRESLLNRRSMANPKAFCSHRSVNKPLVMEVFRKLREAAGIDAWVDEWEILAGQDFVAQINQGLDH